MTRQSSRHVLMIRPHGFGPNIQTAASNVFQKTTDEPASELQVQALREFDALVNALCDAGVMPIVFEDTPEPVKPDALFPNNWISLHADGRVFFYPMEAPLRRAERRTDIVDALGREHGFAVGEIVDLTDFEQQSTYLEGTGSLVLDRINRVAYAAISTRTHPVALAEFARRSDYEIVSFNASDAEGWPIYHTNVMMALGTGFAVLCSKAIRDVNERVNVVDRLAATGREVIEISMAQMYCFAGNLIELQGKDDETIIVLSKSAMDSLTTGQRDQLAQFGQLLPVDVVTIERIGGGSVRCMLAEVFLPRSTGGAGA